MNRLGKLFFATFVVAGAVGLSGCSITQEAPSLLMYEVSASEPGGEIVYMNTAGPAESTGKKEVMSETFWAHAPEVNLSTTTPRITVTPPTGATATCRILQIQGTAVSVVAEQTGQADVEVDCVAPNLEG